jgi:uncharacterized protein YqeY
LGRAFNKEFYMSLDTKSLKAKLSEQIKTAMKAQDKSTLAFGRNLHAAIRKKEIDDRVDLDDSGVLSIVGSAIKQRQDSIEQFKAGGRQDLVDNETAELKFLQSYQPPQLSEAELREIVKAAVAEAQASSSKDMGKVMKIVMPKTQGKADGKLLSQIVKECLGG